MKEEVIQYEEHLMLSYKAIYEFVNTKESFDEWLNRIKHITKRLAKDYGQTELEYNLSFCMSHKVKLDLKTEW